MTTFFHSMITCINIYFFDFIYLFWQETSEVLVLVLVYYKARVHRLEKQKSATKHLHNPSLHIYIFL